MGKIKLIMFGLILLLTLNITTATLLYTEDFESYELYNETWHTATDKWFCEDNNPDNCREVEFEFAPGSMPTYANATSFLAQSGSNKYLTLWSWNGEGGGGYEVVIRSNITTSWDYQKNWSVQFDINYVTSGYSGISSSAMAQRNAIAGLWFYDHGSFSGSGVPVGAVGGKYNDTSEEDFERFRVNWEGSPNDSEPEISLCDINDGSWHTITMHFTYNSGLNVYDAVDVYVDDTICTGYTSYVINPNTNTDRAFAVKSSVAHLIYLDNINFYIDTFVEPDTPSVSNCTTVCDSWSLPTALQESFSGAIEDCGWIVSDEYCFNDEMDISYNESYYYAQKDMDTIESDATRYATMYFTMDVHNLTYDSGLYGTGNSINLRLYDSGGNNFILLWWTPGNLFMYEEDGDGKVSNNFTLNTEVEYKIVIDFDTDTFDIYYNDTLQESGISFTDDLLNIDNIETFKISSVNGDFVFDQLLITSSDDAGNALLPDTGTEEGVVNTSMFMCDLYYDYDKECSEDSDCVTGLCTRSGKCAGFDYTYCDMKGHKRNAWCIFSAMFGCTLSGIGDLILDNFFLFLILLIIVMGFVYLKIMMSK